MGGGYVRASAHRRWNWGPTIPIFKEFDLIICGIVAGLLESSKIMLTAEVLAHLFLGGSVAPTTEFGMLVWFVSPGLVLELWFRLRREPQLEEIDRRTEWLLCTVTILVFFGALVLTYYVKRRMD
jgi:hypothetical protein